MHKKASTACCVFLNHSIDWLKMIDPIKCMIVNTFSHDQRCGLFANPLILRYGHIPKKSPCRFPKWVCPSHDVALSRRRCEIPAWVLSQPARWQCRPKILSLDSIFHWETPSSRHVTHNSQMLRRLVLHCLTWDPDHLFKHCSLWFYNVCGFNQSLQPLDKGIEGFETLRSRVDCWWKKSSSPGGSIEPPSNSGLNYLLIGAELLPSTMVGVVPLAF